MFMSIFSLIFEGCTNYLFGVYLEMPARPHPDPILNFLLFVSHEFEFYKFYSLINSSH